MLDRIGDLVDDVTGGQLDGVVVLLLHGLVEVYGNLPFLLVGSKILAAEYTRTNHE